MALNKLRDNASRWLMPVTKRCVKVHPNTLTWISLVLAILAGASLYLMYWWPYAFLFTLLFGALSSIFDLLDGDLARLTGKFSQEGDFLDHTIDRYSDLVLVLGIVFSPLCSLKWGLVAVTGMLMVSYMGTQAQALNVGRIYGGLLGRADRLLILGVAGVIEFVFLLTEPALDTVLTFKGYQVSVLANGQFLGLHIFTIAMIYFTFAGHYTALFRAVKTRRVLKKRENG